MFVSRAAMRKNDIFPRFHLWEILILLLVIAGGLTALLVNAASSRRPPFAEARGKVLKTFPSDTRTLALNEKAFCNVLIVESDRLSQAGLYPGVVDVEFITGRTPSKMTLFREHDVNLALITLLQSPDQRPSCCAPAKA